MKPLLSIILPAYNEEERLPESLPKVIEFVRAQTFSSEVIIVVNGSTDRSAEIAEGFSARHTFVKTIIEEKAGKGRAVRIGMLAAEGEYRFICDVDLSMPIEQITRFLPPALDSYDIAIGSRELPDSIRYNEPFYRHFTGRIFNFFVQALTIHGLHDTQCGYKSFRAEIADSLFSRQTLDGWTFDVEVLFIAQQCGYNIVEVPIDWYYHAGSRVHLIRDSINMFRDLFRIRALWKSSCDEE